MATYRAAFGSNSRGAKQPARAIARRTIELLHSTIEINREGFARRRGFHCFAWENLEKTRPKRVKKGHMRFKTAIIIAAAALFCAPAWSQDQTAAPTDQYQVSANLTANLQANTTYAGVTDRPTYSGGVLLNLRYRFRTNLAFEANGGFTTYTQYYEPVAGQEQANIYEGTAAVVYSFLSPAARLRPFVEAGGGVLYFSPVATGSTAGGAKVVQGTGVGGLGADWKLNKSFSFRAGYRLLIYKVPSFNVTSQTLNTFTFMSEPYIGLVLRF